MKKSFFLPLLLSFIVLLFSCSKKGEPLAFNPSDLENTAPGVEWVLIVSPYVPCRQEAGYEAAVTQHLRRGEIRRVDGNCFVKVDGNLEKWFLVEEGWLPSNAADLFSNKLKAEKALAESEG